MLFRTIWGETCLREAEGADFSYHLSFINSFMSWFSLECVVAQLLQWSLPLGQSRYPDVQHRAELYLGMFDICFPVWFFFSCFVFGIGHTVVYTETHRYLKHTHMHTSYWACCWLQILQPFFWSLYRDSMRMTLLHSCSPLPSHKGFGLPAAARNRFN